MADRNETAIPASPNAAAGPDDSGNATLRIVNALATACLAGASPEAAATQAVDAIAACLEGVRVSCYLRDGVDTFRIAHSVSNTEFPPIAGFRARPDPAWMRDCLDVLVVPDCRPDDRVRPISDIVSALRIQAFVLAPMTREGKAYGAVTLASPVPRRWTDAEVAMVRDTAQMLSLGLQKAREEEQRRAAEAELLAHRDRLQELVADRTRHLRDAKERAERADRGKTEFLSNISHELRTPLHAILSFARLGIDRLNEGTIDAPKLGRYLERIIASSESLRGMVDDLISLSRLGTDHTAHVQASHDLGALLDAAVWEVRDTLAARSQSVVRSFDTRDLQVWCDRDHIVLALYHLLGNASKFAPEGRDIELHVRATTMIAVMDGEHSDAVPALEITVRDHGPGIPEAELESVFEKFVQSSRTKTGAGGKGLGLAICREIIRLHGAEIRATNHAEGGAIFTFQLPREAFRKSAGDAPAAATTADGTSRWLH
jgi:signal transduction histidine kinase